jgi:hypothetical protein
MTCKILRLSALAGAAALALSAATPAWAWYGVHHARHYGYRTHHVVVHRTAYRYGTYTPAIAAPAVAAGDIVGGAATTSADIVGGAGALASGITGGLFGYPYAYNYTYPYSYNYTYPYSYNYGGATALVGESPYTYNYNCAYGYPSASNPGEYCPPYGYYGAGYYGYPYDYGYGYGWPWFGVGIGYGYGSPYGYGYGYGYRRGFHRFGYGYRGYARTFPRAGVTGAGLAPVRTGVTTAGFATTGERFGGFGGGHFTRVGFGGARFGGFGGAHFAGGGHFGGGFGGAHFAGGGGHFGGGGAHIH